MMAYIKRWWTIRRFRAAIARAVGYKLAQGLSIQYRTHPQWGPGFYVHNECNTTAEQLEEAAVYIDELIERAKKEPLCEEGWRYKGLWAGQDSGVMSLIIMRINKLYANGCEDNV